MMMGIGFLALGLLLVAGLAVVFAGAGWVSTRSAGSRESAMRREATARQILDERLARGEIEADEYERIAARIESR